MARRNNVVPINRDLVGPTIESGIPMPERKTRLGASKYPFIKMKVGQSICVGQSMASSYRSSASRYGAATGKVFESRVVGDGTIRIWRTK